MAVLRSEIERALAELISNEEGMRFQGLAVVLGRERWPDLIACERKKDLGLDAYAPANLAPDKRGKGLASSITAEVKKVSSDAARAKQNFKDLTDLIFVTAGKVGNQKKADWAAEIRKQHGLELQVISREDIIISLMRSANAPLCASFLHLNIAAEPQAAEVIARTKRAAAEITQSWETKNKERPLVELSAVRLDQGGAESAEVLSLVEIHKALSENRRIVLEAPAGRGKTTTLIQLAQQARGVRTAFMVDLPAWTASGKDILDYLAGMPSFKAQGLSSGDLARVQASEPFLFLLNGWNEIAESSSAQAGEALRDLERIFPAAGIIVATRTHHLTPPLPGALRLRLRRLGYQQRAAYLTARLGAKASELQERLDVEPMLDELTRTPFILSEVVSLFDAGAPIPATKIEVLAAVIRLHEDGDHRNALQTSPLFGRQEDYLQALATEMTGWGAVTVPEADARAIAFAVGKKLVERQQIAAVPEPTAVLATLTAHHVLERIDYPKTAFRFEHQQFQEHYAVFGIRSRLFCLPDGDGDGQRRFTADYVNASAWAEPLRMIAETLGGATDDAEIGAQNLRVGRRLVEAALTVDPIFAAELARLCGPVVWQEIGAAVGTRLRELYALRDENYRRIALAAMLATGSADFKDIIIPLLAANDQQVRLQAYRLWPDIQVTSLGPGWREQVRGWSDDARADFASELLHHRLDADIASFAVADPSAVVKQAAVLELLWTRSDDAATRVLESMDARTFEDVARKNADRIPAALRPKTVAALRSFVGSSTDQRARLGAVLKMMELGERDLESVLKEALNALPRADMHTPGHYYIRPALEALRQRDAVWASEWVARQVADGALSQPEYWMTFVTKISAPFVEQWLERLETEDLENARLDGIVAVLGACADAKLATHMFSKLRDFRRAIDAAASVKHKLEWAIVNQLEAAFRALPGDVAVSGILAATTQGDPLDIKVAAGLLSRIARPNLGPLELADEALKARLRAYLKGSVDVVLCADDFNGEEKAHLASSIAQIGKPEDMADLVTLIGEDIERVRRGRAARAAGDRGPRGNGAIMSYAAWHLTAVTQLDPAGAEMVLVDLLGEPEYAVAAAEEMTRPFLAKPERAFDRTFRYKLMWAAREGRLPAPADDERRTRYAAALNGEIKRLFEQRARAERTGPIDRVLKVLATALATIDGRDSAAVVLEVISLPDERDEWRVAAAERLLVSGVVLPSAVAFGIVDAILAPTASYGLQDSDRYLLRRAASLCAFVEDPAQGIQKMRDATVKAQLAPYELPEIIAAAGESRSDAASDLLREFASTPKVLEQFDETLLDALAALDTTAARDLLLSFVDPAVRGIPSDVRLRREDVLVSHLAGLAKREPEIGARLRELCDRHLPEPKRHLLSKVMDWIGTSEALVASLSLIDDNRRPPVPQGTWAQLEGAFVERRPYGEIPNIYTQEGRTSNDLRTRLFKMAGQDSKRRKAAFSLLGQIEEWRLEHGRPTGEPRHPDFASGEPWPPREPPS